MRAVDVLARGVSDIVAETLHALSLHGLGDVFETTEVLYGCDTIMRKNSPDPLQDGEHVEQLPRHVELQQSMHVLKSGRCMRKMCMKTG